MAAAQARTANGDAPAIDWSSSQEDVIAQARSGALTYLTGIAIELHDVQPAADAGDKVGAGRLVAFESDGAMVVGTGSGPVLVSDYRARFSGHEVDDLRSVLAVFKISLPVQFGDRPFLTNRDVTTAELGARAWEEHAPPSPPPPGGEAERTAEPVDGRAAAIAANRPFFADLVARLALPEGGRALDVGCGDGWACTAMADAGLRPLGFDVVPYALATARYHEQRAEFQELDYFEAGRHLAKQGEAFDLIFCRELSPAIKLVDWQDKEWVEATTALGRTLTPAGALVWIHLTDRSERVDPRGFTNPSLATLRTSFESCGLKTVSVSSWAELTAFTLVRADAAPEVAERIEEFDRGVSRRALARLASGGRAETDVAGERIEHAYRAALLELGRVALEQAPGKRAGVAIAGGGLLAELYDQAAVDALGPNAPRQRIEDASEADLAEFACVVLAGGSSSAAAKAVEGSGALVVDPTAGAPKGGPTAAPWVISGDQDANLFALRRPLLAVSLAAGRLPASAQPRSFEPTALLEQEEGWSHRGDGTLGPAELGVATIALGDVSSLLRWRSPRGARAGRPMLAEVIGARLSGADEQAVIACDNGKDRGVLHIGAGEIWIGEARDRTLAVDTAVPQVYLLRVAEGECRVEIGGQSLAGPADPGRRVELELGLQRGYTADSECHWGRVAIGFEADSEPADAAPPAKAVARGSGRGGAREAQTREAPRQQTDAKRKAARR